jgi:hypothetical protein
MPLLVPRRLSGSHDDLFLMTHFGVKLPAIMETRDGRMCPLKYPEQVSLPVPMLTTAS